MKQKILQLLFCVLWLTGSQAQLIQGTIKAGTGPNEIEVWLKPDFSNSTQYLFQIGLPIAFPASASPQPTGLNVALDPTFTSAFGNNYSVTINPVANNTGNTEKYFNIVLVRGGAGASNAQTWTAGTEFKVLTAAFAGTGFATAQVKLADYQDGGSDGQGNFYTQSGTTYFVTSNSIGNFYASSGQSTAGGNASAGFAQTMAQILLPVNIIEFKGRREGDNDILEWTTAYERNNDGFDIERSNDAVNFHTIAYAHSQGNSNADLYYRYEDLNAGNTKAYYRLKEVDQTGQSEYSKLIMIDGSKLSFQIKRVFPNPSVSSVNLIIEASENKKISLAIFDLMGKIVIERELNISTGINNESIDINKLSKGNYWIKILCGGMQDIDVDTFLKQ